MDESDLKNSGTPGAEPGPRAETQWIAGEIAETLQAMAACPTPAVGLPVEWAEAASSRRSASTPSRGSPGSPGSPVPGPTGTTPA